MARKVTLKIEAGIWQALAENFSNNRTGFIKALLGNTIKIVHNGVAQQYTRLGPKISPMTRVLRRGAGTRGNRAGDATGELSKALGVAGKGTSTLPSGPGAGSLGSLFGKSLTGRRGYIRFTQRGFTGGANLPIQAKFLERGWGPRFYTSKQAAFLTHKIMQSPSYKKQIKKRQRKELRDATKKVTTADAKREIRAIVKSKFKDQLDGKFDFALWKGLQKNVHAAPARPFNFVTDRNLRLIEKVFAKDLDRLADIKL